MSTLSLTFIGVLIVVLLIVIFWYVVADNYQKDVKSFSYSRGANIDPGPGKNKGTKTLSCDVGREICVWKANIICTGNGGNNAPNHETSKHSPFSKGKKYGDFDKHNTLDITHELSKFADGKESITYNFDPTKYPDFKCKIEGNVRPQLIASYACIPKGTKCEKSLK